MIYAMEMNIGGAVISAQLWIFRRRAYGYIQLISWARPGTMREIIRDERHIGVFFRSVSGVAKLNSFGQPCSDG